MIGVGAGTDGLRWMGADMVGAGGRAWRGQGVRRTWRATDEAEGETVVKNRAEF